MLAAGHALLQLQILNTSIPHRMMRSYQSYLQKNCVGPCARGPKPGRNAYLGTTAHPHCTSQNPVLKSNFDVFETALLPNGNVREIITVESHEIARIRHMLPRRRPGFILVPAVIPLQSRLHRSNKVCYDPKSFCEQNGFTQSRTSRTKTRMHKGLDTANRVGIM